MKKRLLCTLLTMTLCLAQVLSVSAEGLAADEIVIAETAADDTAEVAGTETEEALAAEQANSNFYVELPEGNTELGVECKIPYLKPAGVEGMISIADSASGKEIMLDRIVADKVSTLQKMEYYVIPANKLLEGDYTVKWWMSGDEANVESGALVVRKSLLKEHNDNMSAIKVESAEYAGKGKEVFPTIILTETANGTEYALVRDVDFKLTVISDNKAKMGAAKVKLEGIGKYAGKAELDYDIAPSRPSFTEAVCNSTTDVKLTWTKAENATGYVIDRKQEKGEYQNLANVADVTTYTDQSEGLAVGETYTYRIRAVAASELDATKEVASAESEITVKIIPGTPVIESISSVNTKKQKLTWKKVDDADGYTIYTVKKGKETKVKDVKSGDKTSASVGKLSTGVKYIYCIKAYKKNAGGEKVYGVSSKTMAKKVTVGTPELVSVTSVTSTENLIKWKRTKDAYGYYILRKDSASTDAKFKKIGKVSGGATVSFSDKKASTGKNYIYSVKAYTKATVNGTKKELVGDYDTKGISGKAVPAKTVFTMVQNTRGVLITIANSEGATGYYLYRKKGDDKWTRRDVPAQAGDTTVYLDKDITPNTSYQYYIVPYTKTGTKNVLGTKTDTMKFTTK